MSKARTPSPRQPDRDEAPSSAEDPRAPLRHCIVTRERYPKELMIRFVRAPDGALVPDLQAKLPGRGAWVIADAAALEQATKKHLFARALHAPVEIDPELIARIAALLSRRCLELLGQALGAGELILGAGAIDSAARHGKVKVVIEATDGRPDGRRKVFAALKAGGLVGAGPDMDAMMIGCFSAAELSLALGRENVIHAALPAGGFASRLMAEARRLEGFRPLIPRAWSPPSGAPKPAADPDE